MATQTPESIIRAAILHPIEEIRRTALAYFTRSHARDETIMPLVIEAVKKYGRSTAFGLLREANSLPQTKATTRWLLDELFSGLDWENVAEDNYGFALTLILCDADLDQLAEPIYTIINNPEFPDELRDWLPERLAMRDWDWAAGWRELGSLGREICEWGKLRLCDQRRGQRIIEALARHSDKGSLLLPLLQRCYRGYNRELMESLECFLVELAGRMQLETAVPILVEHLQEDDIWLGNSCITALEWIGGDVVARALADMWPAGNADFRRPAAEVLGTIHTDISVEHLLNFFTAEKDGGAKQFLANAILENFVPDAVSLIRPMVLGDELTPDENDLRLHLVAASTIMDVTFPEYDSWFEEGDNCAWGWGIGHEADRIREHFREEDEEDIADEAEFDDDWEEEDAEYQYDEEDFLSGERTAIPFQRDTPAVGRNDPCPCGSGKEFKKCCLKKGS